MIQKFFPCKFLFIIYCLSGIFFQNKVYAQDQKMKARIQNFVKVNASSEDSLVEVLKTTVEDSTRLKIYWELCETCNVKDNLKYTDPFLSLIEEQLSKTKDTVQQKKLLRCKAFAYRCNQAYYEGKEGRGSEKALEYIQKRLSIYRTIKDYEKLTEGYVQLADYYADQGNILQELSTLKMGLEETKSIDYKPGSLVFLTQIMFLYANQGDTVHAISYLQNGITLRNEIGDSSKISRGLFLTGEFYKQLKRYELAIEYYFKAIKSLEAKKDYKRIAESYLKIGEVYKLKMDYENALIYYEKAADIADKNEHLVSIFLSIISIGEVYALQGNYEQAIERHSYALKLAEYSKIEEPINIACEALSKDYYFKKDFKNAKRYSNRCLTLQTNHASVGELLKKEILAYKIDSALANYKDAFLHFQRSVLLKNSLNAEEVHKAAAAEKFQDDLEKQNLENKAEQEKKDVLAEKEKQKQRIITYSVAFVLLLVALFSWLLYKRLKLIANQKDIIEKQKHLVEEKHKEISDSINYAERIQRSFLASKELLDKNLKDYFIFFKPKDVVSGDFYTAATLSNKNFALVVADSTGHGVPGAIMSLLNITSLERAIEYHTSPDEILNHTRHTIINRLKKDGSAEGGKDGMDCSLLVFDFKKMKLHIAAAHNPVWIVRTSELIEVKADKMPVGKHDRDKEPFTLQTFDLQKGDLIYTITDGFSDQFGGPNGKKFMNKNLKELLLKNSTLSMAQQKELIERTFEDWIGTYEQVDDVTVVGVRI